jgi:AraC-like DNA-binding protein
MRLSRILRTRAELIECASLEDLLSVIGTRRVDLLIVAPWDSSGVRVAPVLSKIRKDAPSLPVAVYCAVDKDAVREVVALTKAGADEVILRGIDDDSSELWVRLLVSASRRAAAQALIELRPHLPSKVEPIVAYCLDHADEGVTVEHLVATFHVTRRTLRNQLTAVGLPTPSSLISWCRLLLAARFLDDPGRTVEQVALTLGFGSGTALRNMLRRYTGLRPSELKHRGGWLYLVRQFAGGPWPAEHQLT